MVRSNRFEWDLMRRILFTMIYALVFFGGGTYVSSILFGFSVQWGETVVFCLAIGFLSALLGELSDLKAKVDRLEQANSAQSQELSNLSKNLKDLSDLKEIDERLKAIKSPR